MDPGTLDRLAELAVNFGACVQPNQQVVIQSEVGKELLTRAVAEHAYRAGALHVSVEYGDCLDQARSHRARHRRGARLRPRLGAFASA